LKRHQNEYYRLLSAVRVQGDWEAWIVFFLEAVKQAAAEAEQSVITLATLVTTDRRLLLAEPRAGSAAYRLFEMLPTTPRFAVESIRQKLGISFPTANAAVKLLVELGIIEERSGQRKNRLFSYQRYIDILSE
jgi:Fic family protein